jgi:hypothetical protein
MNFEYHSFKVEPYLEHGIQPVFVLKSMEPACTYHTLTDPATGESSVTSPNSEVVRIPVFGLVTSVPENADDLTRQTKHGSLLVGMGLETAIKFISCLNTSKPISRVVVIMSTNCHELEENKYRAYFGVTVEIKQ